MIKLQVPTGNAKIELLVNNTDMVTTQYKRTVCQITSQFDVGATQNIIQHIVQLFSVSQQ